MADAMQLPINALVVGFKDPIDNTSLKLFPSIYLETVKKASQSVKQSKDCTICAEGFLNFMGDRL